MQIAIDIDDTLYPTIAALHAFHNERYGTQCAEETTHTFKLEDSWGCTTAEAFERVAQFFGTEFFLNMRPFDDAVRVVRKLARVCMPVAVTSRSSSVVRETKEMLDAHFPSLFWDVRFSSHAFPGGNYKGNERTKAEICERAGIHTLIEDAPSYAHECAARGIRVILFDRPWNQEVSHPLLITRVHSWNEIESVLL